MAGSACPECHESRFIKLVMPPTSERRPKQVWRYECNKCGYRWIVDENEPDAQVREAR